MKQEFLNGDQVRSDSNTDIQSGPDSFADQKRDAPGPALPFRTTGPNSVPLTGAFHALYKVAKQSLSRLRLIIDRNDSNTLCMHYKRLHGQHIERAMLLDLSEYASHVLQY